MNRGDVVLHTQEMYALVRKAVYDRIKGLLEDDACLMYPALADIDPEDWEDASSSHEKLPVIGP